MIDFIIKYWVEVLLGLITSALTFACRKIYKLYLSEKHHQKTEEQKQFYQGLKDTIQEGAEETKRGDEILQQQIDIMKSGILSIQKRNFKQECKELLKEDKNISLEEFESLQEEHNIYNSLGGNHDGDMLFKMVEKKISSSLAEK